MTTPADPLTRLVVDEAGVNRELLANVLQSRVRLDLGRGTFSYLHGVRDQLGARGVVVTALLAQQALYLLNDRFPMGLAPRDLEAVTGVQGGTLRPILKRLHDRGLARKADAGEYHIPGYALEDVAGELNSEE